MTIKIETLAVGPLEVNCYVVGCTEHKVCAIFDPGDSPKQILDTAKKHGWEIRQIINTHGHADHTGANSEIKKSTNAPISIHLADATLLTHPEMKDMAGYLGLSASPEPDELLTDSDLVELCPCLSFTLLATPGHTEGGSCFQFGDSVITGDTLFKMSVGRTDLMGGDTEKLISSLESKLLVLPEHTVVYPGHGEPTTIGYEKANNPFLMQPWRLRAQT